MFGHQNDISDSQGSTNMVPDELVADGTSSTTAPMPTTPMASSDSSIAGETSGAPVVVGSDTSSPISLSTPEPVSTAPSGDDTSPISTPSLSSRGSDSDSSGLLDLKQQALQQLSPLINHLDQTPEEKFRTTMMMIQANDDQSLIKTAYEAAQEITDEKVRAQALLDVVNEINYFTQHNKESAA